MDEPVQLDCVCEPSKFSPRVNANVNSSAQNHSGACEGLVWLHGPRLALPSSNKLTSGVYLKIVFN